MYLEIINISSRIIVELNSSSILFSKSLTIVKTFSRVWFSGFSMVFRYKEKMFYIQVDLLRQSSPSINIAALVLHNFIQHNSNHKDFADTESILLAYFISNRRWVMTVCRTGDLKSNIYVYVYYAYMCVYVIRYDINQYVWNVVRYFLFIFISLFHLTQNKFNILYTVLSRGKVLFWKTRYIFLRLYSKNLSEWLI